MEGKLIIFSAPSGSGKTTIVRHLLDTGFNLEFSISACNRAPRGQEVHGKDYYFLTTEDFQQKIKNNEFVEWEEVYEGRFYGTLKSEVERIWKKGNHVLFDVDVVGGVNLKKQFADKALAVFVMPPSIDILEQRLNGRATDSKEEIAKRVAKAEEEIAYARHFDHTLLNDNLEAAKNEAEELLTAFLK
ncbi:MAG: guanylate kinase [Salinivirgaceae bacterium]|nr:guanylate kinase [Salinivirgaceae bacterium]